MHAHACAYMHMHMHAYARIYIHMHAHTCICMYMHDVHAYASICMHTHADMYETQSFVPCVGNPSPGRNGTIPWGAGTRDPGTYMYMYVYIYIYMCGRLLLVVSLFAASTEMVEGGSI